MSSTSLLCRSAGVLCLLFGNFVAAADNDAHELLRQMATASDSINFRGSFTHEHGSSMESFRVLHWVDERGEFERLEQLSGPEREVVRHLPSEAACRPVGDRLFHSRLSHLANGAPAIDDFYQVVFRGEERIAGREANIVQVVPKDQMRYGYVLSLDAETGLLLKSVLLDEQQRLIERFQFVDFEPSLGAAEIENELASEDDLRFSVRNCTESTEQAPSRWALQWLPPGFEFSGQKRVGETMEMLMYTDGLANFSVFIQPREGQFLVEGRVQRGATTAYMGAVSDDQRDYRLTVVGEIPVAVAEKLAQSVVSRSVKAKQEQTATPAQ